MQHSFTSPFNLPFFTQFLNEREGKINTLINNLTIEDVKEDDNFNETVSRIKGSILLETVSFDEPFFVNHEFTETPLSFQQQLEGGSRNHFKHNIQFSFNGNVDLFKYCPQPFTISTSDRGIIIPYSDYLNVYIDLRELNPELAIEEAKKLLSSTMELINKNNSTLDGWNVSVGQRIDELLEKKRAELIKIFN